MPATTENHLHLSEIAPHIIQSEIRSMTVECDAVGGVNLAQGVCDTPLPAVVEEAAIQAIRDGLQHLYPHGRDCRAAPGHRGEIRTP